MYWHVRPLQAEDHDRSRELYAGYAAFYRLAQTDEQAERTWTWLMNRPRARSAVQIGLAHCWAQVWPVVRSAKVGHRDPVMAARHAGVVERGGQVNQSDVGVKESEQRDTAAQQNRRTGKHDVVD